MPQDSRRSAVRVRSYLKGRVFYGARLTFWADCALTDLTTDGARLKLPNAEALPETFILLLVSAGLAMECELRWRRGDLVGARFLSRHDLSEQTEERLWPVRAAWRALH